MVMPGSSSGPPPPSVAHLAGGGGSQVQAIKNKLFSSANRSSDNQFQQQPIESIVNRARTQAAAAKGRSPSCKLEECGPSVNNNNNNNNNKRQMTPQNSSTPSASSNESNAPNEDKLAPTKAYDARTTGSPWGDDAAAAAPDDCAMGGDSARPDRDLYEARANQRHAHEQPTKPQDHGHELHHQPDDVDHQMESDDQELVDDYMGLDTIVEEDESLAEASERDTTDLRNGPNKAADNPPRRVCSGGDCASSTQENNTTPPVAPATNGTSGVGGGCGTTASSGQKARPDQRQRLSYCMRKFTADSARVSIGTCSSTTSSWSDEEAADEEASAATYDELADEHLDQAEDCDEAASLPADLRQVRQPVRSDQIRTSTKPASKSTSGKQTNSKTVQHQDRPMLPSTNRLISEHKARQSQSSLLRTLERRQKLIDRLGPDEQLPADLFSSSSIIQVSHNRRGRTKRRHRRRRRHDNRSHHSTSGQSQWPLSEGGVPLSALDLSSMPDRELDQLLHQIASASASSSSSSSSSSSHSSTPFDGSSSSASTSGSEAAASSGEEEEEEEERRQHQPSSLSALAGGGPHQAHLSRQQSNLIGVHDNERSRQANCARSRNCRDATKADEDKENTDDEDDDEGQHRRRRPHLLRVDQVTSDEQSAELEHHHHQHGSKSSSHSASGSPGSATPVVAGAANQNNNNNNNRKSSKLERYFTSDLVSGHDEVDQMDDDRWTGEEEDEAARNDELDPETDSNGDEAHDVIYEQIGPTCDQTPQPSVERVLERMLLALGRAGAAQNQARLNRLLERGFSHLEHLLSCNLNQQPAEQQQQITPPSSTSISPSSPGSSLQPPDGGPAVAVPAPTTGAPVSLAGAPRVANTAKSVAPSSMQTISSATPTLSKDSDYGSDTQSADCFSAAGSGAPPPLGDSPPVGGGSTTTTTTTTSLSPAAVELTFRLAESLQRLAEQQRIAGAAAASEVPAVISGTSAVTQQEPLSLLSSSSVSCSPQPPPTRPKMRSVVTVNATPTSSPIGGAHRNRTPSSELGGGLQRASESPAQSTTTTTTLNAPAMSSQQPFKTCVSIGGGGGGASKLESSHQDEAEKKHLQPEAAAASSLARQTQVAPLRRSLRLSARRTLVRAPDQPRPGSPVPKMMAQSDELHPAADRCSSGSDEPVASSSSAASKQRQLQRALMMAQKYNYSPAKLAASKLGSKLHLRELLQQPPLGAAKGVNEATEANRPQVAGAAQQQTAGQVQLDISYFARSGSLTVHVIQCANLRPANERLQTSNPYIKLYLLPDRSRAGKRKSACLKGELAPKFEQKFSFGPLQLRQFDDRCLWLAVWHRDERRRGLARRRSSELLGELLLPLGQVRHQLVHSDLCQSTSPSWYALRQRRPDEARLGSADGRQVALPPTKNNNNNNSNNNDKLDEFQRRAQRLALLQAAPQAGLNCTLAPPVSGAQQEAAAAEGVATARRISGQLFVALKFVPDNQRLRARAHLANHGDELAHSQLPPDMEGELQVHLREAQNVGGFEMPAHLLALDKHSAAVAAGGQVQLPVGPLPSPMCKCYLVGSSGRRLAKLKSPAAKRTANPRWNHKLAFPHLRLSQLPGQALEVHLFDRPDSSPLSGLTSGASRKWAASFLGAIRLCCSSETKNGSTKEEPTRPEAEVEPHEGQEELCDERESRLWRQMIARPNIWVYGELRLHRLRALVARPNQE